MPAPNKLPPPLIPLNFLNTTLEAVGGKALNLAKLTAAGFPVPPGFFIPTSSYHHFLAQNNLATSIENTLRDLDTTSPEALNAASTVIREGFAEGEVSGELIAALEAGWRWLGAQAVAVRSSATAEDLPGLSFAGQQDTFLNVVGVEALLKAVVGCWSSLWTGRAIGYRARNSISHLDTSLSVIVQTMVQSTSSGVMFTANPLTGLRSEIVIDAALGLGEALVGGHVEPDHYIVDVTSLRGREAGDPAYREVGITSKSLGSKSVVVTAAEGGGVAYQEVEASQQQAIPDDIILQLANTGKQIEALYKFPQDIEWAYEALLREGDMPGMDGKIHILQSRPITSLFPIPEDMEPEPLQVMFSFGAVQGILDPWTPLGKDAIRLIFAGGASQFGFEVNHETQGVIKFAGERLWGNITPVLRHPVGVKVVPKIFPVIEPGSLEAIQRLISEPSLGAGEGRLRFSTFRRMGKFAVRMMRRILPLAHKPEGQADRIKHKYEAEIARFQDENRCPPGGERSLKQDMALFRGIYDSFIYAIPEILPPVLVGLLPLVMLNKFSKELTGSGDLALEITRGISHNVTTEMDLALWGTAQCIREDEYARNHFDGKIAGELVGEYLQGALPETAQSAISGFLEQYGMRGVGELDIGCPRWREDPTPIIQVLLSYLKIEAESMAPDAVFMRGTQAAEEAMAMLEAAARKTFLGGIKSGIIRAAARRVRALAGMRESPKFFIIKKMDIIRRRLLERGAQLVVESVLEQPDDVFFLYLNELEGLAEGRTRDWRALVDERRSLYNWEKRRSQIPRLLLSDGRAFYEGIVAGDQGEDILIGSPVSPGVTSGNVRVILDPHQANLVPGEILVCPGTDPAWTPLFLAAGGLVMEVGGMMTHGAIIAREYGIPAVVGVDRATTRLVNGQKISVDGSTGEIRFLE